MEIEKVENELLLKLINETLPEFELLQVINSKSLETGGPGIPHKTEDFLLYFFHLFEINKKTLNLSFNVFCVLLLEFYENVSNKVFKGATDNTIKIKKRKGNILEEITDLYTSIGIELNRYELYHDMAITKIREVKTKATKETHLSAPERLLVLDKIGFNELPFVKNLNDSEYKILISTILNYDKRSIDGYINGQKE